MDDTRLIAMPALAYLFKAGTVLQAEAIRTEHGWKLFFLNGKDRFSHSRVGLRAARGGERFYKSLDSIHDLLVKLGCKTLVVSVHQREVGSGEPPASRLERKAGVSRVNPELERLHELKEKERRGHLTRAERDERKHLDDKFSVLR